MPRDLPIGNGNLLVAFDKNYLLREFFFPHVGEENHTLGRPFRLGLWVNGQFNWLPTGWQTQMDYLDSALVTKVELSHPQLGLHILANDTVDFHENIYLKKLTIENLTYEEKEVRLFFAQDFCISGNEIGDTAEYRPESNCLIHYKGARYFLISALRRGAYGLDQYATGNGAVGRFEGTWKDAEDGILSGNSIAQGSVDSVAAIHLMLMPKESAVCYYWIAAGQNWDEVRNLNEIVKKKTPEAFFARTLSYWHLWVNKEPLNKRLLSEKIFRLYDRSLLILRTQINNCGSIIAANDSDVMLFNRDTYSYMWPRDGALTAYALDLAGYGLTTDFYKFCAKIIEKEGYLRHKYNPSGTVGSSWHPWTQSHAGQLPIQEDETALVLWALWNHYALFKDIEFIKPLYKTLVKRAADFMMSYIDAETGLPLPSYDLWEERQGILTFTVAAVFGGLIAAANFAAAFGELELEQEYRQGAARIRQGMDRYLYLEKEQRFARMINIRPDRSIEVDATIDASLYGCFAFGAYDPHDPKVQATMSQVSDRLWSRPGGGLVRYENDPYFRAQAESIGNPWFVTTLWLAQYHIAIAADQRELEKAIAILDWVADHALPSGVLAEQIDPVTHEPLSVAPLTWSHASFVATVQQYLNRLVSLQTCPTCGLPKISKFQTTSSK